MGEVLKCFVAIYKNVLNYQVDQAKGNIPWFPACVDRARRDQGTSAFPELPFNNRAHFCSCKLIIRCSDPGVCFQRAFPPQREDSSIPL